MFIERDIFVTSKIYIQALRLINVSLMNRNVKLLVAYMC